MDRKGGNECSFYIFKLGCSGYVLCWLDCYLVTNEPFDPEQFLSKSLNPTKRPKVVNLSPRTPFVFQKDILQLKSCLYHWSSHSLTTPLSQGVANGTFNIADTGKIWSPLSASVSDWYTDLTFISPLIRKVSFQLTVGLSGIHLCHLVQIRLIRYSSTYKAKKRLLARSA